MAQDVKAPKKKRLTPAQAAAEPGAQDPPAAIPVPAAGAGAAEEEQPQAQVEETQSAKMARGICAMSRDQFERIVKRGAEYLKTADAAPESAAAQLEELENMLRKGANFIAIRAAILRYGPQEPDPLLAVTARNVRSLLSDSGALLDHAAHAPGTWKRVEENISEASKAAKAVQTLLVQDGAHIVARQDPPLQDEEGKPLVPAGQRG